MEDAPWHTLSPGEVLERLGTTDAGLDEAEAGRRLAEYGLNELEEAARVSPLEILLSQFRNVLILILLLAQHSSGISSRRW